jgi:hypothetical protein
MVRMRQPLAARAVTGGSRSGRVRAGSGPQVWREGSPEMACAGRQPHDYTLSGNEEKTGRDRAAMRGTARIRGRGALLLVAAGWMVSAPGSSHAQEKTAQQVDSQGAGGPQAASQKSDTQVGTGPSAPGKHKAALPEKTHRFWDKENDWLFAGVGASRTLDYFSTLNMRRRGRQEIFLTNEAVDNHAAFAAIEASATGVSIGAAYLFHRYGHHKLERWTSFVHMGLTATGSVRNYCLKTAHFAQAPGPP